MALLTNRMQQAQKWLELNLEGMSFDDIASRESVRCVNDKITRNTIAGAIYRLRKAKGISPQKSPIINKLSTAKK